MAATTPTDRLTMTFTCPYCEHNQQRCIDRPLAREGRGMLIGCHSCDRAYVGQWLISLTVLALKVDDGND